jgi:hypothetical protein
MNKEEVLSLFAFVGERPLQVTLRHSTGKAWATNMPILMPWVPEQFGDEPMLRLASTNTYAGLYSDFYVKSVRQDDNGNLVLTREDDDATATFQVGGA